jgi:hypothetical protein
MPYAPKGETGDEKISVCMYVCACVDITAYHLFADLFTSLIYPIYLYQNVEAKEFHSVRQFKYVFRQFVINEKVPCRLQTRNKKYFKKIYMYILRFILVLIILTFRFTQFLKYWKNVE